MKPEDESFTGKCPTCGQEYLAERVRELSAEVERLTEHGGHLQTITTEELIQRVIAVAFTDMKQRAERAEAELAKVKAHADQLAHYTDCYAQQWPHSGANYAYAEYRSDYPRREG